ncbi:caspase family protein [Qipengyuania marisflavi]|uniref:Caspase family protein n=1 Tax=Qipengyuania marisflavi TaxID=2486356 RepID=A0A5S3P6W0_9SPHN|nr:caspase family protein [Qipengyuania marisflavi]TMM48865.1 caspase family protein [Qipengyuania marisflavi]
MIILLRVMIAVIAVFGLLSPGMAEARKVALIIGNSDYEFASPLRNPKNDVALIAEAAREANFDEVIVVENLGSDAFEIALRQFATTSDGADVAMVYYAGHGIEGRGENWLIPVDAKLLSDRDLKFEVIELDMVVESMAGAQVRMVILDACRNSPFGQKWKSGTRAVSRGLAGV